MGAHRFRPYYRSNSRQEAPTDPMSDAILPWQIVRVSGPSMVPTLHSDDVVIVRHGAAIRAGDVVLATFRSLPDRLVLKRAVRTTGGGWWLVSDNPLAGGDSTVHGVADVHARVWLRVRGGRVGRVR
jgi:phage repressor protein C with HTH and peptisase S24 domain